MKNILKVIGLSLSAALSCSADKCWNCNVNDATGATSGLCEKCRSQKCSYCGGFDVSVVRTGLLCEQCLSQQYGREYTCTHCGKVDPSVIPFPVSGFLCEECRSHRCDYCCNFDPSVEHFLPGGFMCEQCRKTQQNPFGM